MFPIVKPALLCPTTDTAPGAVHVELSTVSRSASVALPRTEPPVTSTVMVSVPWCMKISEQGLLPSGFVKISVNCVATVPDKVFGAAVCGDVDVPVPLLLVLLPLDAATPMPAAAPPPTIPMSAPRDNPPPVFGVVRGAAFDGG